MGVSRVRRPAPPRELALGDEAPGGIRSQPPPERGHVAAGDETIADGDAVARQPLRDGEAVEVGKLDVEEHDLRTELRSSGDRACSVLRLADHVEVLRLEQRACRSPEAGMVVDDQHRPAHARTVAERGGARIGAAPESTTVRSPGGLGALDQATGFRSAGSCDPSLGVDRSGYRPAPTDGASGSGAPPDATGGVGGHSFEVARHARRASADHNRRDDHDSHEDTPRRWRSRSRWPRGGLGGGVARRTQSALILIRSPLRSGSSG